MKSNNNKNQTYQAYQQQQQHFYNFQQEEEQQQPEEQLQRQRQLFQQQQQHHQYQPQNNSSQECQKQEQQQQQQQQYQLQNPTKEQEQQHQRQQQKELQRQALKFHLHNHFNQQRQRQQLKQQIPCLTSAIQLHSEQATTTLRQPTQLNYQQRLQQEHQQARIEQLQQLSVVTTSAAKTIVNSVGNVATATTESQRVCTASALPPGILTSSTGTTTATTASAIGTKAKSKNKNSNNNNNNNIINRNTATNATQNTPRTTATTKMSSLISANILQNPYNLNYTPYNNSSSVPFMEATSLLNDNNQNNNNSSNISNGNNNTNNNYNSNQQHNNFQSDNYNNNNNNNIDNSNMNNNPNNYGFLQMQQTQQQMQLQLAQQYQKINNQQQQSQTNTHLLYQQQQQQQSQQLPLQSQRQQQQQQQQQQQSACEQQITHSQLLNKNLDNNCPNIDKFSMDACEIANFLANELFMQQLVSMDGIQSGVPTLTTPTLTPTTLRNIEESFIQLTSDSLPYQAGFIPPPLGSFPTTSSSTVTTTGGFNINNFSPYETDSENSQSSFNANNLVEDNSSVTTDFSATDSTSFQNGLVNSTLTTSNGTSTNDFTSANIAIAAAKNNGLINNNNNHNSNRNTSTSATTASISTTTTRRNQGGRRPTKSTNATPEEEEKRRVRRERNKLAAARCRKRRVDQTNDLLQEVDRLEKKREDIQKEYEKWASQERELSYILKEHRPTCQNMLAVTTLQSILEPTTANSTITGIDTPLSSTLRSTSPIDLKPVIYDDLVLVSHIKNEPLDTGLDSGSSLDHDGPPSPKRMLTNHNPMILPLPNVATLSPSLAAASASLNTPVVTTAPDIFHTMGNNPTLNALNKTLNNVKQRPNSLPTMPRNLTHNLPLNVDNKPPTDINGVAIQTPSTGMFNFDSLMDGGTGLTPVSGPLVPTCSSQNKHPLELTTPTSEPSKLVSL